MSCLSLRLPLLCTLLACGLLGCSDGGTPPGGGPAGGGAPDAGADPGGGPQAWTLTGRVTDADGRPLPGISIEAEALRPVPQSAGSVTGADGRYRLPLDPTRPGVWHVRAVRHFTYAGDPLAIPFEPTDPAEFAGTTGAVRDFVWPGLGEGVGTGVATLHTLFIDGAVESDWELARTEVTLEPLTPLLDGSTGRTRVATPTGGPEGTGVYGVPYARYRLSARYADPERGWVQMCVREVGNTADRNGSLSAELDFRRVYSILTLEAELGVPQPGQDCD